MEKQRSCTLEDHVHCTMWSARCWRSGIKDLDEKADKEEDDVPMKEDKDNVDVSTS